MVVSWQGGWRRAPALTRCPASAPTRSTEPPASARTCASRSGVSVPDTAGPVSIVKADVVGSGHRGILPHRTPGTRDMKHRHPTPATLRTVYLVRIAFWVLTVYLVAGPLRVFKETAEDR